MDQRNRRIHGVSDDAVPAWIRRLRYIRTVHGSGWKPPWKTASHRVCPSI